MLDTCLICQQPGNLVRLGLSASIHATDDEGQDYEFVAPGESDPPSYLYYCASDDEGITQGCGGFFAAAHEFTGDGPTDAP